MKRFFLLMGSSGDYDEYVCWPGHILAYNEANDEFKLVDPDYGTVFVRADSIELIPGPDDPREDA